jgi:hypothetical protein
MTLNTTAEFKIIVAFVIPLVAHVDVIAGDVV